MEREDNWKQFLGSELGSVLSGIYGNQRPKINYPAPKKKTFDPSKTRFLPVNANVNKGATDPRKTTRRNVSHLPVPQFKNKGSRYKFSAMDLVPKRRGADEIRNELDEIDMRMRHYRPAVPKLQINENEKERYSQICAYKGGKGFIKECSDPVRDIAPFEYEQIRLQKERENTFRKSRNLSIKENVPVQRTSAKLSDSEALAEQIALEIDERCAHLEEMDRMGSPDAVSKADRTRIKREIDSRVKELKSLENI